MKTIKDDLDGIGRFVTTLVVGYAAIFGMILYQGYIARNPPCQSAVCVGINAHYDLENEKR
jgi:hypothetical protein